jgi:hypothetical protein
MAEWQPIDGPMRPASREEARRRKTAAGERCLRCDLRPKLPGKLICRQCGARAT